MAVVALTTGYNNADGLRQRYGVNEATVQRGGEYSRLSDGRHCVEVTLDLLALSTACTAASGNECIICDNVTIPNGAFIEELVVVVTKETAGVNANLDLGLVDQDRSTEIDFNGFLAASDDWNAGTDLGTVTSFKVGSTEVGALVGTKITNTGLITASPDTADFTAGVLKIRIFYSTPLAADL
jgi:hypothetical protein